MPLTLAWPTSPPSTAPRISAVSAALITPTTVRVSWLLDQDATGQVEYGTTSAYGSTTTLESSSTIHIQTLEGLSANTLYHYRVKSTNAGAQQTISGDQTFTTEPSASESWGVRSAPATPTGSNVYTLTGADPTGVTDATLAIWNFIDDVPDGVSAGVPTIVVFPAGTYKLSSGVHLANKHNVTLWGYGATLQIDTIATFSGAAAHSQWCSAFIPGRNLVTGSSSSSNACSNINVFGFTAISTISPTPAQFNATYENQHFYAANDVAGAVIADCTSQGFGGDFVRVGYGSTDIWVHHNESVNQGRQYISLSGGGCSDILVEYNIMGEIGYYFFDLEPESAAPYTITDAVFRKNRGTTYYGPGASGGFLALGNTTNTTLIARVSFVDNEMTGTNGANRYADLRTYIGQNLTSNVIDDVTIDGNTWTGNRAFSSCPSGMIQARRVDGLIITDNTGPGSGGLVCIDGTCTSVTNTGNAYS